MKKLIFFGLLFFLLAFSVKAACVTPVGNITISGVVDFCNSGSTYYLTDKGVGAIRLVSSSRLNCNNTIIVGNGSGIGLYASANSGASARNCEFRNFSINVQYINANGVDFNNSRVNETAGNISNTQPNIYFLGSQRNSFINNVTSKDNPSSHGVYISGTAANITIMNSFFYNNGWYTAGTGVQINIATGWLKNITVVNCSIHDNNGAGIQSYSQAESLVADNLIYNNNNRGVVLSRDTACSASTCSSTNNTFTRNVFANNSYADIFIDNLTTGNKFIGNTYNDSYAHIQFRKENMNFFVYEETTKNMLVEFGSGSPLTINGYFSFNSSNLKNFNVNGTHVLIDNSTYPNNDYFVNGSLAQKDSKTFTSLLYSGLDLQVSDYDCAKHYKDQSMQYYCNVTSCYFSNTNCTVKTGRVS